MDLSVVAEPDGSIVRLVNTKEDVDGFYRVERVSEGWQVDSIRDAFTRRGWGWGGRGNSPPPCQTFAPSPPKSLNSCFVPLCTKSKYTTVC